MPHEAQTSPSERRSAFLDGEGTLTHAEIRAWADEIDPARAPRPASEVQYGPLMVALVDRVGLRP